jgi:hypothetical protein
MWLNFKNPGYNQAVYMTNGGHTTESHGVAMLYRNGHLAFHFRKKDGTEWRVNSHNVLPSQWYHVGTTWSKEHGLRLYINGDLVDSDTNPVVRSPEAVTDYFNEFYIGRPNDGQRPRQSGFMFMDEFHFWSREKTQDQIRENGEL